MGFEFGNDDKNTGCSGKSRDQKSQKEIDDENRKLQYANAPASAKARVVGYRDSDREWNGISRDDEGN